MNFIDLVKIFDINQIHITYEKKLPYSFIPYSDGFWTYYNSSGTEF